MAVRTVSNTGGNWNSTSTWVEGAVPTTSDNVVFTATSGDLIVNINTANILGIDFTNYVGTVTFNAYIQVIGAINLGTGGYTQSGALGFAINGTSSITSNGVVWSRILRFFGTAITFTLNDNLTITGEIIFSSSASATFNGNTLNIGGSLTFIGNPIVSGTTSFVFNGTGTWSHSSTGALRNNLTINTLGTLTISGAVYYNTGTLTYTAGTVVTTGSTLNSSVSTTFATNGINWNNVTLSGGSQTYTFSNDFTVAGTLSLSGTTATILTGSNIFITGNLSVTTTATTSGTTLITFNGTGSQTWSHSAIGYLRPSVTINKPSGTLTISGNIYYGVGTLTYISGTVNAAGSLLNINASATLNTGIVNWNIVEFEPIGTPTNITITMVSDFRVNGRLTVKSRVNLSFTSTGGNLVTAGELVMGGDTNGVTSLSLSNNITITNFSTYYQAATNNYTLNGYTISITGNLTINMFNNYGVNGTTTLKMIGTGNLTYGSSNTGNFISNPFTIDTSGTITITGTINPLFSGSTITYTNGAVTGTGVIFSGCTLNLNSGGQWGTDVVIRSSTILTSDATFGNLTTNTNTVAFSGAFNVNVKGNLAINVAISGASTPIIINGTGNQSWTHGSAVYLSNDLTINKPSGILTLGTNVYYQTGTLTYVLGNIDLSTNNSILNLAGSTTKLDTSGIIWNRVSTTSGTFTLLSNFYCNNYTGGGGAVTNNNGGGDMYLYKNLTHIVAGGMTGTATIYFAGGVTWKDTSNNSVRNNIIIDTSETVTFDTLVSYQDGTITFKRGKVNAKNCNFSLGQNVTLINFHKINFDLVTIVSGVTLTMNEFFNGSPSLKTTIQASSTTNYGIAFTDNFEKIAKFVDISNCTLSRPQQLLVLTDSKKSSTNTRGIRHINNLPNGISKGDPSVQTQLTYGANMLINDPNTIKY